MLRDVGSKGVYEAVGPLMKMEAEDLEKFVSLHAALDPHFPDFLQWARSRGIDVKIVSDGFDATIRTLLRNHDIEDLEIFANRLVIGEDGSVELSCPHADPDCGTCGTCKTSILRSFRSSYDTIILIGDGESDRHAAAEADLVLALRDLFVYCAREGIPAIRVEGFSEIPGLLARRIDSVVFDMDGTLIDSLACITDSFNHMFEALGYPSMTIEEVARKTSISLSDFANSFLKPGEAEKGIQIFRDYYDTIYLDCTMMMPGAREALEALDGTVVTGVITNKRGKYARKIARHLGFDTHMSRIIGAQDGFRGKPAADMFEEFVRSSGTRKDRTVYVGDSPLDVEGARNAGIDTYAVAGPIFSAEELALHGARRVLQRIEDLPDTLKPVL
jgi:HAD superfamily phosphoserine phosphatase-like hydrolase